MANAIVLKNVKKTFRFFKRDYMVFVWLFTKKGYDKEFKVLDGISFKIKKGEVVGILGKNGAGKSTILKIISGIYYPTSGSVKVNGTIASLLELGAGFQKDLTGRENIYFKGSLLGLTKDYLDANFPKIAEFADIGDYIDMPLGTYSSGMAARLGFSLAVNADPDILIIDEVFAVGDKNFQQKSRAKTIELLQSGKTVLFVSHSENLIAEFCERVIYLKDGKVAYDGDVDHGIAMYHADNLKLEKEPMIGFVKADIDEYSILFHLEYGKGANGVAFIDDDYSKFRLYGTDFRGAPLEDMLSVETEKVDHRKMTAKIEFDNLELNSSNRLWYSYDGGKKRQVEFSSQDETIEGDRYVLEIRGKDSKLIFTLKDINDNDNN
jgi:teichoic acid transport system ATP-binding protein